ncbi:hypothetical protein A3Q56_01242 [Intoshia linei]|uniref:Large ribosomal subunit protein mL45 n=1 Tax=Intoshia linei TaxID=1819745 RepID=A0A177B9L2_9BILA|nr:hypothetical protein A3Q56_01242 [Intoshia linei]
MQRLLKTFNARIIYQTNRHIANRHYLLKFRKMRAKKVLPIDLPDFQEAKDAASMTIEEMRSKSKRDGITDPVTFQERNINITNSGLVIDEYKPQKSEGYVTSLKSTPKYSVSLIKDKVATQRALRNIRHVDPEFNIKNFMQEAHDIYFKVIELSNDYPNTEEELFNYVTELAYPNFIDSMRYQTVVWKLVNMLEAPKLIQVRTVPILKESAAFSQITIKFYSKQKLAIYDRFGRLIAGSPDFERTVLEYIVFEKPLKYDYSSWRIHSKINPIMENVNTTISKTTFVNSTQ